MGHLATGKLSRASVSTSTGPVGLAAIAIAAFAVLIFWLERPFRAQAPVDKTSTVPLPALVAFSVPFQDGRGEFDLNFAPNTRYLLVVGSLGSAESRFSFGCSSRKVSESRLIPVDRIPMLGTRRLAVTTENRVALKPLAASNDPSPQAATPIGERSRTFSLHVTDGTLDDPAQYVTVRANAIATGRHVRVYLDDQQVPSSLAPGLVRSVIELFDTDIVPRFRGLLGTYRDVDHDGRFAILLSPWLAHLQGGRTSVGGFVRGSDFQSCLGRPFSNRCDMMYINSLTTPGDHLRTLLIHEYTHAVCFSRRTSDSTGLPKFPDEEDWLNEAIAHCAESLFGGGWSNLDYRIARFLNEPSAYPLVVSDYYRAGLWRCHGCRGATYLFLRFCVEQFGAQTLTRLIANPSRGTQNLELATGHSFEEMFRAWTLWLAEAGWQKPAALTVRAGESPEPELAPLDLYGSLGDWGFAGPQSQRWNVDTKQKPIELRGTSAAYLELVAGDGPGPRRICIQGTNGSMLLASVLRLQDDSCSLRIDAEMAANALLAKPARTGDRIVHVVVHFPADSALTVELISAEQNRGETRASTCFAGADLKQIESRTSKPAAETASSKSHEYFLPAARLTDCSVPIIVSVIARDREGHRTPARAILPPTALLPTERLAQHSR
jgi:hypothetical protein